MQKNFLIGVGVVIIVIVSFYFFSAERAAAPEEHVPEVEVVDEQTDTSGTTATDTSESAPAEASTPVPKTPPSKPSASTPTPAPTTPAPTAPKSSPTLPYNVTVIYEGGRFIPDDATVIEGGTVRFMNTSDKKMWIASDNHPTHTRYPIKSETSCMGQSFDQCTAIGTGESWSFVFTRVGTWGYHNHERAQDTGSIRVMTKETYLKEYQ